MREGFFPSFSLFFFFSSTKREREREGKVCILYGRVRVLVTHTHTHPTPTPRAPATFCFSPSRCSSFPLFVFYIFSTPVIKNNNTRMPFYDIDPARSAASKGPIAAA